MLEDSDRLLSTIEQVLRTGRVGSTAHRLNPTRIDLDEVVAVQRGTACATLHHVPAEALRYQPCGPATVFGDLDEIRAAVIESDRQRREVLRPRRSTSRWKPPSWTGAS